MTEVLPYGDAAVLAELGSLEDVLGLYAALRERDLPGVVDLVPAARTVLVRVDPDATDVGTVAAAVRDTRFTPGAVTDGGLVEVPVVYDGDDLDEVGELTGWGRDGVVERHTSTVWTVAFSGFAPGFGYLVADGGGWDVPRRSTPRTRVPAGAVGLAGEFSGVYPRVSPGGWQLIGRTELAVFDVDRDPAALLSPGTRVRFVARGG